MSMKVLSNIEVQSVCVELAARCVGAFSTDIRFVYAWLRPYVFPPYLLRGSQHGDGMKTTECTLTMMLTVTPPAPVRRDPTAPGMEEPFPHT